LKDGAVARDIATSSGFPKNTLSRAIHKLVGMGLVDRTSDAADRRRMVLTLTPSGRSLFEEALPRFVDFEHMMLEALTEDECTTLSRLMAKLVEASPSWPDAVDAAEDRGMPTQLEITEQTPATPKRNGPQRPCASVK
jgi:hypothetical protein